MFLQSLLFSHGRQSRMMKPLPIKLVLKQKEASEECSSQTDRRLNQCHLAET